MKEKFTPWFPYTVRPSQKGVYKRKTTSRYVTPFSYWTGYFWCIGGYDPQEAESWRGWRSSDQRRPWRGLAENPAKKGKK